MRVRGILSMTDFIKTGVAVLLFAVVIVIMALVFVDTRIDAAEIEVPNTLYENNILILIDLQHFCVEEHWKGKWNDTTFDACSRFAVAIIYGDSMR